MLANHCMPVLHHIKPATLFNLNINYLKVKENWEIPGVSKIINRYQCSFIQLYINETRMLIYLYQPELLEQILQQQRNQIFLSQYGYELSEWRVANAILCLKERYLNYKHRNGEFPHEIGILLGYPLDDVSAYITNNGQNCLYQGCWKVYHNVEQAKIIFQSYRELRDEAVKTILLRNGLKKI